MFKKIAITAILLGMFLAGSLIAEESSTTYHIALRICGVANEVVIGYKDYWGYSHELADIDGPLYDGTYHYTYDVPIAAWKFYAEGWGPGGAYDYDECYSSSSSTNHLVLVLNKIPQGPPQEYEQ
jgi:hypothetical protein